MLNLKKLAVAATLLSTTYAFAAPVSLGTVSMNSMSTIDQCEIKNFRLRVESGSGYLKNVTFILGDNKTKQVDLYDRYMEDGEAQRFEFSRKRCLKAIILTGEDLSGNFNARLIARRKNQPAQPTVIRPGDRVVENVGQKSIRNVQFITEGGIYKLSDGYEYRRSQIEKVVSSFNGLTTGQTVIENVGQRSQRTISILTDAGSIKLSDGYWYTKDQILTLLNSANRISVGETVVETVGQYSFRTISIITSDNQYKLSDGYWYSADQLQKLVQRKDGIRVGERVLETVGSHSQRNVTHITESGEFKLSDGYWYKRSNLQKIYN